MKKLFYVMMLAVVMLFTASSAQAKAPFAMTQSNRTSLLIKAMAGNHMGDWWIAVRGRGVRIRATPSLKGKIVGKANWGDSFLCTGYIQGRNGMYGWYAIWYGGRIRYINEEFAG